MRTGHLLSEECLSGIRDSSVQDWTDLALENRASCALILMHASPYTHQQSTRNTEDQLERDRTETFGRSRHTAVPVGLDKADEMESSQTEFSLLPPAMQFLSRSVFLTRWRRTAGVILARRGPSKTEFSPD